MPNEIPAGAIAYTGYSRIPEALPRKEELSGAMVTNIAIWLSAVTVEIAGLTRKAAAQGFDKVEVLVRPENGSTVILVTETKEVTEEIA
jgi:hypothetical protein